MRLTLKKLIEIVEQEKKIASRTFYSRKHQCGCPLYCLAKFLGYKGRKDRRLAYWLETQVDPNIIFYFADDFDYAVELAKRGTLDRQLNEYICDRHYRLGYRLVAALLKKGWKIQDNLLIAPNKRSK